MIMMQQISKEFKIAQIEQVVRDNLKPEQMVRLALFKRNYLVHEEFIDGDSLLKTGKLVPRIARPIIEVLPDVTRLTLEPLGEVCTSTT